MPLANVEDLNSTMFYDVPPNSSKNPKVGHRTKQWMKKKVGAHSLTHSISGVGRCVGAVGLKRIHKREFKMRLTYTTKKGR
jgi:hypothetical protein